MKHLPPAWKIKRELLRLKSQSLRLPQSLLEPAIQRCHDAHFQNRIKVTSGNAQATDKIALFLIWQPDELAGSILHTIRELRNEDFSIVAVSNAPLTEVSIRALREQCVLVVERPNFGYDFGGYRDGIRLIQEEFEMPDTLLILNDSIWYPLWSGDQTLARILENPAPFKGLLKKRIAVGDCRNEHLKSHFLVFERPVLQHPSFDRFWKTYPVSSNRHSTIRRGEYGISAAIIDAGLPAWGVLDVDTFETSLRETSPNDLRSVLRNVVHVDPQNAAEIMRAVQSFDDSACWHDRAMELISRQTRIDADLITTAYIYASIIYCDLSYAKKRREEPITASRRKLIQMVDTRLVPPLQREVDREIRVSV